ncbi:MAG: FecR domain-containing protein [Opitutaceae bacterium]|nr:FecR domain-containing protein [Opitutaceae bacterium]
MPRLFSLFLFALAMLAFVDGHGQTVAYQVPARATVIKISGEAFVLSADRQFKIPLQVGAKLQQGQTLVTEKGSSLVLVMPTGTTLQMAEDTTLGIDEFTQTSFKSTAKLGELKSEPSVSTTRLNLVRGEILSDVKKLNRDGGSSFEVRTPIGAAGIRGTAFKLGFIESGTSRDFSLLMGEGRIEFIFGATGRGIMVNRGQQLVIRDIRYDPSTGRIVGMPKDIKVEEVDLKTLGELLDGLSNLSSVVESITITGQTDINGKVDNDGTAEPDRARPDSDLPSLPINGLAPSGDPAPVRTSPLDGNAP